MTGNIQVLVEFCQRTDEWADALVFSQLGKEGLFDQVKAAYFDHKRDSAVVRLARAISTGKLRELAVLSPLSCWKQTLCVLLTYAKDNLSALCVGLGDRLKKKGMFFVFCFLFLFLFLCLFLFCFVLSWLFDSFIEVAFPC